MSSDFFVFQSNQDHYVQFLVIFSFFFIKLKSKYKTGFLVFLFLSHNKTIKKLTIFLHFLYFCSIIEYTVLYVYVVRQWKNRFL